MAKHHDGQPEIAYAVGDVVSGTVTDIDDDIGLLLDVDGLIGFVASDDLALADGESAQDRYTVGETIDDLFICQIAHETRHLALSVKRNAPGYLEALQQRAVGDVVSGTVIDIDDEVGLLVDVDGLHGGVLLLDLDLGVGESAQDRYTIGETINDLFVWAVDHETRVLGLSAKRNAPGYLEALERRTAGEVVAATVAGFQRNGGLWLNVDGLVGAVVPQDLDLDDGGAAQDRYAVGDTINDLFVWQVDHETRVLGLSAKRNAPGYLEALERRTAGEVVAATVTFVDDGLWLDVDGLVGDIPPWELDLAVGESARDRYSVGETIKDLFVWGVNHKTRSLDLSAKRNAPGYLEALQRRTVGDVVSATVTFVDDGLWLDVDGLVGDIPPWELDLAVGESARDRYSVGETIKDLFVWGVNHKTRSLDLSARRNAPGYLEALQQRAVGDVASATVTAFQPNSGLWLDVDGLAGTVAPMELNLNDGESTRDRYTVGETIEDLLIGDVDHEDRVVDLSAKRNAPGYLEALQRRTVGDVVSGTITAVGDGLWLDVDGLVGTVDPRELNLNDGESARDRYATGETINSLFVWGVNHETRKLILSMKRSAPGYLEALQRRTVGDVVSATVTFVDDGLWLDVDGLVGDIPPWELDLAVGESARERYAIGQTIEDLFVCQVNHEDRDLDLSAKRNTPGYREALEAIARGDEIDCLVANANEWGVWLSAAGVVGWIPASELLLDDGESPSTRYTTGDEIKALVWQIDHEARDIVLSVRRL